MSILGFSGNSDERERLVKKIILTLLSCLLFPSVALAGDMIKGRAASAADGDTITMLTQGDRTTRRAEIFILLRG